MNFKARALAVKKHVVEHKVIYSCAATGVVVATFTYIIMRGIAKPSISRDVIVTTGPSVTGTRNRVVINNVSYISANRQGPPSWIIRCKETGDIFTSQHAAALALGITETNISKHLNGLQEHAQGYTFERLCMAA